jgi:hypothetical protein
MVVLGKFLTSSVSGGLKSLPAYAEASRKQAGLLDQLLVISRRMPEI